MKRIACVLVAVLVLVLAGCGAKRDHAAEGKAALEREDYDLAERCYTLAVEAKPADPAGWVGRARARNGLRRYEDAVKDATEAIRLDPQGKEGYSARSVSFLGLGDEGASQRDRAKAGR